MAIIYGNCHQYRTGFSQCQHVWSSLSILLHHLDKIILLIFSSWWQCHNISSGNPDDRWYDKSLWFYIARDSSTTIATHSKDVHPPKYYSGMQFVHRFEKKKIQELPNTPSSVGLIFVALLIRLGGTLNSGTSLNSHTWQTLMRWYGCNLVTFGENLFCHSLNN